MSLFQDVIVRDSDKQFRIRITPSLRTLGIFQIIGTKRHLDVEFIGGDCITVFYPTKIENLPKVVESDLLLETQLSVNNIDNIKYYVKDILEEIEKAVAETKTIFEIRRYSNPGQC